MIYLTYSSLSNFAIWNCANSCFLKCKHKNCVNISKKRYNNRLNLRHTSSISSMLVMACRNSWERGMISWVSSGESSMSEERADSTCSKSFTWETLTFDKKLWKLDWILWPWEIVAVSKFSWLPVTYTSYKKVNECFSKSRLSFT